MKKYFIFLSFISLSFKLFGQGEANIWYFGLGAGLDFNTIPPKALLDGKLFSREGVSTICNKDGKLLFYSDGTNVWNAKHTIMPNGSGLLGDYSSTQSSIAVPNPADSNKYYLFTTAYPQGLRYNEIDMRLDNNRGDIIPGTKNKVLVQNDQSTEKLIATKHCNNKDYWVLSHIGNSNQFCLFLVNETGVIPMPRISIGSYLNSTGWEIISYLKFSPDGGKIANTIGIKQIGDLYGKVELMNFDNQTGAITGPVTLIDNIEFPYGAEFSPNGNNLFVSSINSSIISQYNLLAPDVKASRQIIKTSNHILYGALQLAKDGKIYITGEDGYNKGYTYLDIINKPDVVGLACDYQSDAIFLEGAKTLVGLPTFSSSFFYNPSDFIVEGNCMNKLGDTTFFKLPNTNKIESVEWDFGDGNHSVQLNPYHIYSEVKKYNIQLIINFKCYKDTINKVIDIGLVSSNIKNVSACEGTSYVLPDGTVVDKAGTYTSTFVTSTGCDSIIQTNLTYKNQIEIYTKDSICEGKLYTLPDGTVVDKAGIYTSTFVNPSGCDSIVYTELSVRNKIELYSKDTICEGDSYTLPDGKIVDKEGNYISKLTSQSGCDSLIYTDIKLINKAESFLNDSICNGSTYQLPDGTIVDKEGNYTSVLNSSDRCDSIVYTNLKFRQPFFVELKDSFCLNSSYTFPDGSKTSDAGVYHFNLQSNEGCDSNVTYLLSIIEYYRINIDADICQAESYVLPNGKSVNSPGIYIDTINGQEYCDTIINTLLKVHNPDETILNGSFCEGDSVYINQKYYKESGVYIDSLENKWGCDSIIIVNISIADTSTALFNFLFCKGDTIKVGNFIYTSPGEFINILKNSNGCDSTIIIDIKQGSKVFCDSASNCRLYIPNAFSPNDDGTNDYFETYSPVTVVTEMSIYDRWGGLIYYEESNQPKWDGTGENHKPMNNGVFVYIIKGKCRGEDIIMYGDVTLVR